MSFSHLTAMKKMKRDGKKHNKLAVDTAIFAGSELESESESGAYFTPV